MSSYRIYMNIDRLGDQTYVNSLIAEFNNNVFDKPVVIIKLEGPDHYLQVQGLTPVLFNDLINNYAGYK